jgi:hypothetical protein
METRELYTSVIVTFVGSKLRNPKVRDAINAILRELGEEKAPARCVVDTGFDCTHIYDKVNAFLDENFKGAELAEYDYGKLEEKLMAVVSAEPKTN